MASAPKFEFSVNNSVHEEDDHDPTEHKSKPRRFSLFTRRAVSPISVGENEEAPVTLEAGLASAKTFKQSMMSMLHIQQRPRKNSVTRRFANSITVENLDPADARKLFGTDKNVLLEAIRQKEETDAVGWIIHPFSPLRWKWDLLIVSLLFFTLISLPVSLAFFSVDAGLGWVLSSTCVDFIFLIDVALNFRTGYVTNEDLVVLSHRLVSRHYLKSWFFVDFVSSLPTDLLFYFMLEENAESPHKSLVRATRFFRVLRTMKVLRILQLSRFVRYMHKWQERLNLNSAYIRIYKLVFMMLMYSHWNGCIQFLIAHLMNFPSNSWVSITQLQNKDAGTQYVWSLFNALSHMLCIGYGQYPPVATADVVIFMVSMTMGATMYAIFIGNVSGIMLSIDYPGRMYRERLQQVNEYLRFRQVPEETRQKVRAYYELKFGKKKLFDESAILEELSPALKTEISMHNCSDLVDKVPFFQTMDKQFVGMCVTLLDPHVYSMHDYIIKKGTFGNEMFFLRSGVVEVLTGEHEEKVATHLSDGSYFGEIALVQEESCRRTASIRACTPCFVYTLSRRNWEIIVHDFPEVLEQVRAVAEGRLERLKQVQEGLIPENKDVSVSATEEAQVFNEHDGHYYEKLRQSMKHSNVELLNLDAYQIKGRNGTPSGRKTVLLCLYPNPKGGKYVDLPSDLDILKDIASEHFNLTIVAFRDSITMSEVSSVHHINEGEQLFALTTDMERGLRQQIRCRSFELLRNNEGNSSIESQDTRESANIEPTHVPRLSFQKRALLK